MLRGIAMAGMVLVNNPGSWQHVFPLLRHAGWNGCTIADLVFPFFLFALGSSLPFSLAGTIHSGKLTPQVFVRIMRRALILFLLGIVLNMLPGLLQANFSGILENLRIMGVLQRIALVYFAAALLIVYLSPRILWAAIVMLLAGYGALLAVFPGPLTPDSNPALFMDRLILGRQHMYHGGLDPEGLFSSIGALTTTLLGYAAGIFLQKAAHAPSAPVKLFSAGLLGLALGSLWGLWLPVSKDLWTGSYVLVTAGWAAIALALSHAAARSVRLHMLCAPLQSLGRNALVLFVGSGIAMRLLLAFKINAGPTELTLWSYLYEQLFASLLGHTETSSFFCAAAWLALWWLALLSLDKKKWRLTL